MLLCYKEYSYNTASLGDGPLFYDGAGSKLSRTHCNTFTGRRSGISTSSQADPSSTPSIASPLWGCSAQIKGYRPILPHAHEGCSRGTKCSEPSGGHDWRLGLCATKDLEVTECRGRVTPIRGRAEGSDGRARRSARTECKVGKAGRTAIGRTAVLRARRRDRQETW
jgi:hypothetical protein